MLRTMDFVTTSLARAYVMCPYASLLHEICGLYPQLFHHNVTNSEIISKRLREAPINASLGLVLKLGSCQNLEVVFTIAAMNSVSGRGENPHWR